MLRKADRIVIVGYSLPETDQFFRYLFPLGVIGETRLKKVVVVDPGRDVFDRFAELMGPSTREILEWIDAPFEEADIESLVGPATPHEAAIWERAR